MAFPRLVNDIAAALIERALHEAVVLRIVKDCSTVTDAMQVERGLLTDLGEKAIPLESRQEILKKALGKEIHPYVLNALLLLQRQNALKHLPAFCAAVIREAATQAKHHTVFVTSAVHLQEKERKKLETVLQQQFDGTFHLTLRIDPGLLGGMIVTVGDWQVNSSVKGKLERLKNNLYV